MSCSTFVLPLACLMKPVVVREVVNFDDLNVLYFGVRGIDENVELLRHNG